MGRSLLPCYPGHALLGPAQRAWPPVPCLPTPWPSRLVPPRPPLSRRRRGPHVAQDQRRPVLCAHVLEGCLDLIAAFRAQCRGFWVGVAAGRLREVRYLTADLL